ncbi:T9SS type A sorting domain-containing protein [Polluticoccus soli]|uniref:T9SS type A sorting domain-containing protein n=1 Tax=Polluticoccus soli TaxID=3034150 RepID=UPI0023E2BDA9|nr:T9SS type A sorting domain-containing protein [Flavipsychrobacter sp. JY13-12]
MRSKLLLFLPLLIATAASAQTPLELKAQTDDFLGHDSLFHVHAAGKNSTILPQHWISEVNPWPAAYPQNGNYQDDTTFGYYTYNNNTTKTLYAKNYNSSGLITEYHKYKPASGNTPVETSLYTYTSAMLPDTIWHYGETDSSRIIHAYNGTQLAEVNTQIWNSVSNLWQNWAIDSFFVSGPGSDSIVKHLDLSGITMPAKNYLGKYTRDANNLVLIDSQFNNNNFESARFFIYDAQGRVSVDSFVDPIVNFPLNYDKRIYTYNATGDLLSIKIGRNWGIPNYYGNFFEMDSFSYNADHQLTSVAHYNWSGTAGSGSWGNPTRTQKFYYGTTVGVPEVASHNNNLQLYPIPATSYINLSMQFTKPQAFSVRIFDMQGRLVSNWQEAAQKQYNKQVPLTNMTPGQYTVHILAGNESISRQFTVVR